MTIYIEKKYFNYINDNTRHFTDIISSKQKTKTKKAIQLIPNEYNTTYLLSNIKVGFIT